MAKIKKESSNIFARFFDVKLYITLKNMLFNYKFRKYMLAKAYQKNKYLVNASKNMRMLDVGCGISPVSPLPSQTIFIDSDKNAIDLLNKQGYLALKGDISHLPINNKSIDCIFCSEVLEHVPDFDKSITEFKRILRNKGLLFLTVPTHMHYWSFDDEYVGHLRRFDPLTLSKQLSNRGFKIIELKPIGSFIERLITKLLVKSAIKRNEMPHKIDKGTIQLFRLANRIFFGLTYLGYLLNTQNSSSILLVVAQKK